MPTTAELIADAKEAEKANGLPDGLLVAMIQQESGFNPNTSPSSVGAIGIAQFMPATAASLGLDPTNAHDSIWAAARMVKDDAIALNGGKAPDSSDLRDDAWLRAAAAYNAGRGAVQSALTNTPLGQPSRSGIGGAVESAFPTVSGIVSGVSKAIAGKSWRDYLPDETKDYLNKITSGSNIGSWQDAANASTAGKKSATTSTANSFSPVTSSVPDINKYQRKDEDGNQFTDPQYYADMANYAKTQETMQSLQSGPLAKYVDDVINDISKQIEANTLDARRANDLLTTKVNSFKNANDVYASSAFQNSIPVGTDTLPGTNIKIPGAGSIVLNPLQQALDTNNQAQSLFSSMQPVKVPSVQEIMAGYQGQYGGSPGGVPQGQSNPLQAAMQNTQQQNGAAPTGPVQYTGFNNTPPPPPPTPPMSDPGTTNKATDATSSTSVSDIAALARILAQQAQGIGAPN